MKMNELDLNDVGSWPTAYKAMLILLAVMTLIISFYVLFLNELRQQLSAAEVKEKKLKQTFILKAERASSLSLYQQKLNEDKSTLTNLVNQLPSKKELARLLDDISFIGANNGLQFKSMNWGKKKHNTIYDEVPISIKVIGHYAQLGQFSADIAALPRLVILDHVSLKPISGSDQLMLDVIAQTYRYKAPE